MRCRGTAAIYRIGLFLEYAGDFPLIFIHTVVSIATWCLNGRVAHGLLLLRHRLLLLLLLQGSRCHLRGSTSWVVDCKRALLHRLFDLVLIIGFLAI